MKKFLLLGVFALLALVSCKEQTAAVEETAVEAVEETATEAVEAVEETATEAVEAVEGAATEATEEAAK